MSGKKPIESELFFLLTGGWVAYAASGREWILWLIIAMALLSLTPLAGYITRSLDWLVQQLALGLLKLALVLVFFLILLPISLIRRLGGANRKFFGNASSGSNWHVREHAYSAEDLRYPW